MGVGVKDGPVTFVWTDTPLSVDVGVADELSMCFLLLDVFLSFQPVPIFVFVVLAVDAGWKMGFENNYSLPRHFDSILFYLLVLVHMGVLIMI